MIWTIVKSVLMAFSLTLAMLSVVYTIQARDMRASAPIRIGEARAETPFLVDYAQTRSELLMEALRDRFPQLGLPEPEPEPVNPLSLQALRDRTIKAQQSTRVSR